MTELTLWDKFEDRRTIGNATCITYETPSMTLSNACGAVKSVKTTNSANSESSWFGKAFLKPLIWFCFLTTPRTLGPASRVKTRILNPTNPLTPVIWWSCKLKVRWWVEWKLPESILSTRRSLQCFVTGWSGWDPGWSLLSFHCNWKRHNSIYMPPEEVYVTIVHTAKPFDRLYNWPVSQVLKRHPPPQVCLNSKVEPSAHFHHSLCVWSYTDSILSNCTPTKRSFTLSG